jgi:hypothetical protein
MPSRGGAGGVGLRVRTHPVSARDFFGYGANPVRKNYPNPPMPYGFVLMHSLAGLTQPKNPSAAPDAIYIYLWLTLLHSHYRLAINSFLAIKAMTEFYV